MANKWGNSRNSDRLYFLTSKITANGDCSHEIKRHLLLGRKAMTNLDSILKSRDIILPTKVHLVKAMVFPVWMWELDYKESWVLKNWCFWTMVLEKTLESPLECKEIKPVSPKGNQFLNIHWKDWCWSELQYFGHLIQRADSLERPWCWGRLRAGGEEGDRGWDGWMASPTQWTWVWANSWN